MRPGGSAGAGAGAKVLTLVASVLVGGCCIDDAAAAGVGLSGGGAAVRAVGAVDAGDVLRSFTFGHVRQLDKAAEMGLVRAWSVGAAPDVAEMTVDLDSTVCEVCGKAKHGAAYGHTKVLGYHPLVAVRSDTGEVLHSRMRSGSSQRGNVHFARETLARVRRLAPDSTVTVRADAGFFSYDMIAAIGAHGASYSITIPHNAKVKAAVEAIDDDWASIEYTRGGEAQVAETTIEPGRRGDKLRGDDGEAAELRLIARRSRLLGAQGELWPNWRYHCFVTDRDDLDTKAADAYHRGHATVELAIRDLKEGSGLSRCPSGRFFANGAWLACCVLAHNLVRWTARLGGAHPHSAAHRRGHHPQPAPHSAGPPRQPQRPPQAPPAVAVAMGHRLHQRTPTNPQPAPWSSEPPTAPGAAQPHPTRHQPAPAPHSRPARPHTHTTHPRTNPGIHQPQNRPHAHRTGGFRLREREGEVPSRHSPGVTSHPARLRRASAAAIAPSKLRSVDLSAQYSELVAQHDDLEVLGAA